MAYRNHWLLFFFFLSLSCLQAADTLRIPSSIHTVLLYAGQAEVKRTVSGQAEAGHYWIKVPRISSRADARSVRVETPSDVRLNKVALFRERTLRPQDFPRLQKAIAQVEKRKESIHQVRARIEGVQAQMEVLRANQRQDFNSTAQLEQRAAFYAQKMTALQKQALDLQEALRKAQEAKQKQEKKLQNLRQELEKQAGYWLLQVEMARTGKFSLELQYRVSGAYWESEYQATRIKGKDSLELTHKALIHQNTGVPWQEVKLSLALGAPLQGSELPELPPFYIEEPKPIARNRAQPSSSAVSVASDVMNMKVYEGQKSAPFLQEKGIFRVFKLRSPVSLGLENPGETRTLRRYTLPAAYRYESHPAIRPAAFLQARITGFAGLPLPAGEVNRFNGNTYVGRHHWAPRLSQDTISLSLGRDADVQVNRQEAERFTNYKMLGQKKELTLRHKITIQNDKSHPIELLLRERIPISRTEKVNVERLDSGGRWDKEKGHLIYQIELAPGEKKTLRPGYRVTAPKDFPLPLP